MKNLKKQSVEQLVLTILQKGTISSVKLIKTISQLRSKSTKQGVYRVLRKLKLEEKIIIHGKSISLNLHWIKKMNNFFSLAQYYYSSNLGSSDSFLNLQEKDKIIYSFKNLNQLDAFWTHVFYLFDEVLASEEAILLYNPHEWFAYGRQEVEQGLIETMKKEDRRILLTLGHADPLDKAFRKSFRTDLLQCNIVEKNLFKKDNYYLNIFSDVLIEAFIDEKIAKEIDKFFKETKVFNAEAKARILEIVSKDGKNKLVISKNKKKAEKYKKILMKDFR